MSDEMNQLMKYEIEQEMLTSLSAEELAQYECREGGTPCLQPSCDYCFAQEVEVVRAVMRIIQIRGSLG